MQSVEDRKRAALEMHRLNHEAYLADRAAGKTANLAPVAVPYEQWPWWQKKIADHATPDDRGTGDVVARAAGKGGVLFKIAVLKLTGHDCGCDNRQALWNLKYPLKDGKPIG